MLNGLGGGCGELHFMHVVSWTSLDSDCSNPCSLREPFTSLELDVGDSVTYKLVFRICRPLSRS